MPERAKLASCWLASVLRCLTSTRAYLNNRHEGPEISSHTWPLKSNMMKSVQKFAIVSKPQRQNHIELACTFFTCTYWGLFLAGRNLVASWIGSDSLAITVRRLRACLPLLQLHRSAENLCNKFNSSRPTCSIMHPPWFASFFRAAAITHKWRYMCINPSWKTLGYLQFSKLRQTKHLNRSKQTMTQLQKSSRLSDPQNFVGTALSVEYSIN